MTKKTLTNKAALLHKQRQKTMAALTAVCGVVVSGASLKESLGRIAVITSETMRASACSVMVYNHENQELSVAASKGYIPDLNNKISVKECLSLPGTVIKEKKIMTSRNAYSGKPILPGTAEFSDIRSMISAPIMYNGEPIGVINTYVQENRDFSGEEKITMQAIADQSAAAIQLEKLREEASNAKEALKERKLIEKAKGILMRQKYISEEQAYTVMRSKSMDTGKPIKEIAEAVILTNEIKYPHKNKR